MHSNGLLLEQLDFITQEYTHARTLKCTVREDQFLADSAEQMRSEDEEMHINASNGIFMHNFCF